MAYIILKSLTLIATKNRSTKIGSNVLGHFCALQSAVSSAPPKHSSAAGSISTQILDLDFLPPLHESVHSDHGVQGLKPLSSKRKNLE